MHHSSLAFSDHLISFHDRSNFHCYLQNHTSLLFQTKKKMRTMLVRASKVNHRYRTRTVHLSCRPRSNNSNLKIHNSQQGRRPLPSPHLLPPLPPVTTLPTEKKTLITTIQQTKPSLTTSPVVPYPTPSPFRHGIPSPRILCDSGGLRSRGFRA